MKKITVYKDKDISKNLLLGKTIGIIGYGNQGRAQALNLKDSGLDVIIGLRSNSKSQDLAIKDGFNKVVTIETLVKESDIICCLIPDEQIPNLFSNQIKSNLKIGQTLLFSHGYSIHFNYLSVPDFVNVILVAPSGSGLMVRKEYKEKRGVPNLIAVHQDYTKTALDIALSYSMSIGGTKIGAFLSTFEEETITDIFGEQAILTGGLPQLIQKSFNTLVESGYSPAISWLVCYYEVKSIIDSFHNQGFEFLSDSISNLAEYGGVTRGERLIDKKVDSQMKEILDEIKNGVFEKEWKIEKENNYKTLKNNKAKIKKSKIEKTTKAMLKIIKN